MRGLIGLKSECLCFAMEVHAVLLGSRIEQVNKVIKLTRIMLHHEICRGTSISNLDERKTLDFFSHSHSHTFPWNICGWCKTCAPLLITFLYLILAFANTECFEIKVLMLHPIFYPKYRKQKLLIQKSLAREILS